MAERVSCWTCGRRVSPKAQACEHCGAMLLTLCEECGTTVSTCATECTSCGAGLMPRSYRPRRSRAALFAVLVLLLFAAAVTGFVLVGKDSDPWPMIEDARSDYEAARYQSAVVRLRHVVERWPGNSQAHYLLALAQAARSDFPPARRHARIALDLNPDLPGPHLVLAICAYEERDFVTARDQARRMLLHSGSMKTERLKARAHLLLGKIHSQPDLADLRRAAFHLQSALDSRLVDDPLAWLMLGEISLTHDAVAVDRSGTSRTDHYLDRAKEAAGQRLEATPDDDDLRFLLARIAYARGELESARRHLETIREPGVVHEAFGARITWQLGREAEARGTLDRLRPSIRQPAGYLVVADAYRAIGDLPRARAVERASLERFPANLWLIRREVRRLLSDGETDAARALAERGLAEHPQSDLLVLALADALAAGTGGVESALDLLTDHAGGPNSEITLRRADLLLDTPEGHPRLGERLDRAEQIIRLEGPDSLDLFPVYRRFLRGKAALRRQRPDVAAEWLDEVTRRVPTDAAARRLLATAHLLRREYERQARELSALIRLRGSRSDLLLERGEAWLAAGFLRDARRDILEVRDEWPRLPEGVLLQARLQIAEDGGRVDRAIETLAAARPVVDDPFSILVELGLLRARAEDHEGAERELLAARAAASTPEDRLRVTDALSRVRAARDGSLSSAESRRTWEKFLEAHPDSVSALVTYASRLLDAGDADGARPWIEKALARAPGNPVALRLDFDARAIEGDSPEELALLAARVRQVAPETVHDEYVHGRLALLRSEPADAARLLGSAARRDPGDAHIAFYLAVAHAESRNLAEAAEALDRALELEPHLQSARRLLAAVHLDWADELIETGRPSRAVELLGRSLEHDPDDPHLRALRTKALYHAGFRENPSLLARARRSCEELLADLDTRGEEAPAGLREPTLQLHGAILMALGDWAAAEAAFRRHLDLRPEDVTSLHSLGVSRVRLERAEEALPPLRRALELDPDRRETLLVLIDALLATGRRDQADDLVSRRIAARPEDTTAHTLLGRLLQQRGQVRKAETIYRDVLRRDPDHLPALDGLVYLLVADDRVDDAVAAARDVMRRTSHPNDAGVLLGHALLFTDPVHPEAQRLFRAAVVSGTHRDDLWLRALRQDVGILLRAERAREVDLLEAAYSEWIRNRRTPLSGGPLTAHAADAWYYLARAWSEQGSADRAESCYRRALNLAPDHVRTLNNLADLVGRSASTLPEPRQTARLTDALALARRATEVRPRDPHPWDTLGSILLRLDRAEDALPPLERARQLAEERGAPARRVVAAVLLNLARAHDALDRPRPAQEALERALALDPTLEKDPEALRLKARFR